MILVHMALRLHARLTLQTCLPVLAEVQQPLVGHSMPDTRDLREVKPPLPHASGLRGSGEECPSLMLESDLSGRGRCADGSLEFPTSTSVFALPSVITLQFNAFAQPCWCFASPGPARRALSRLALWLPGPGLTAELIAILNASQEQGPALASSKRMALRKHWMRDARERSLVTQWWWVRIPDQHSIRGRAFALCPASQRSWPRFQESRLNVPSPQSLHDAGDRRRVRTGRYVAYRMLTPPPPPPSPGPGPASLSLSQRLPWLF